MPCFKIHADSRHRDHLKLKRDREASSSVASVSRLLLLRHAGPLVFMQSDACAPVHWKADAFAHTHIPCVMIMMVPAEMTSLSRSCVRPFSLSDSCLVVLSSSDHDHNCRHLYSCLHLAGTSFSCHYDATLPFFVISSARFRISAISLAANVFPSFAGRFLRPT